MVTVLTQHIISGTIKFKNNVMHYVYVTEKNKSNKINKVRAGLVFSQAPLS